MRAVDYGRRVDRAMMTEVRALLPAAPKHVFIYFLRPGSGGDRSPKDVFAAEGPGASYCYN
jgi:hypothetical protein